MARAPLVCKSGDIKKTIIKKGYLLDEEYANPNPNPNPNPNSNPNPNPNPNLLDEEYVLEHQFARNCLAAFGAVIVPVDTPHFHLFIKIIIYSYTSVSRSTFASGLQVG
jgi:hypothetical protein